MKTRKLIESAIMLAIDKLKENIEAKDDEYAVLANAKAIKVLAEAYDIVHRGKREDYTC